ncbi:reverse transcriptase family protein [Pseudoduganella guangdongensis]|nr:reverse transcriptase family protein [Pseudoduganella guangdongensis]
MDIDKLAVLALADTMLASDGSMAALVAACHRVFAAPQPWAPRICAALIEHTGENFHYFSRHELADRLWQLLGRATSDADVDVDDFVALAAPPFIALPPVRRYCIDLPQRPPAPGWLAALALPELATVGDLAAWLGEPVAALDWFADQWRLDGPAQTPLQHYHYRWVPKRSGGWRLIEIPKERLRRLQQRILRQLLDRVPPHPAAHGFRRGHSCLTHATLHAGQRAVIRMDLKDFFTSVQPARIHALFAKLGYPPSVAGTLARLCVNRAPHGVLRDRQGDVALPWSERQALKTPHLPQGAPSSPALANLCAYRLDLRLAALARTLGASYSRYADDLAFSGGEEFARAAARLHIQVAAIALEEGFRVNTRKTRLMRAGARQQVTGVVVNAHPNLARDEYDRLKAMLTNCVRHGPATQNRAGHADFRAHLAGKISHVRMLNPQRAGRLQAVFDAIRWDLH